MKIAMLNLADTRSDPRVRRIAGSLSAHGHAVTVISPGDRGDPTSQDLDGFTIRRIARSRRLTPLREIQALRDECPEAAQIVEEAEPAVLGAPDINIAQWIAHRVGPRLRRELERRAGRPTDELTARQPDPLRELAEARSIVSVARSLRDAALSLAPDLVHANDLDTLLAGFLVSRSLRIPLVYDAHEIFPEQFPSHRRSALWHGFFTGLEAQLVQHTDARFTVCGSLARHFETTYGCEPFDVIHNVPSLKLLPEASVLEHKGSPREVLYHGAYFNDRGLETVIEAAAKLPRLRFVFRGLGPLEPELRRRASAGHLTNLHFAPAARVDELVGLAARSDIGLSPFPAACLNTELSLPNKFFEYLMAGLATVSSDLPEIRSLTDEHDLGALFEPGDADSLAGVLEALVAAPSRLDEFRFRAHALARDRFHWEIEESRLLDIYRKIHG